jgi:RNA polymerase sigma-70 factor (ECF subfamily)
LADADTTDSDADLARRLVSGDQATEGELFRRLAPRIRLFGLRQLRDSAAADDLVQDVILMTFDALRAGKVRETERIGSYVLGTCRRVVADLRRGAARRQGLLERFGSDLLPPPAADEPVLDLERLTRCLASLAERERSVVMMSFYEERDAQGIATDLGMTPANVRVVRHRALGRLRACMKGTP